MGRNYLEVRANASISESFANAAGGALGAARGGGLTRLVRWPAGLSGMAGVYYGLPGSPPNYPEAFWA